jgi:uncharacterized protein (DUF1697 family)
MDTYIALLRGINVGGKRRILMQDLKELLITLGFENVQTYIQSGNVVFESNENDKALLAKQIQTSISDKYAFKVPTIVIEASNYQKIIKTNPFVQKQTDLTKLYLIFLEEKPKKEAVEMLNELDFALDKYIIKNKVIYIQYADKISNSKINTTIIERKLNVVATARNWRTSLKLLSLIK